MEKFQVFNGSIRRVEIVRETEKSVFIECRPIFGKATERREAKNSEYCSYHDTFEQAKDRVVSNRRSKVENLQSQLIQAEKRLEEAESLDESQLAPITK